MALASSRAPRLFKGRAGPVPGSENRLQANTAAIGQTLRTALKPDGVQAGIESAGGETASFESQVEMTGDGGFLESGTIRYGTAGSVRFHTLGRGVLGPSPLPGIQRGAVIWEVTAGDGRFQGAQGLITSNFVVGADGAVVDDHFVRLYLPS